MSEYMIPIPSRVYNAAVGGHVAGADQIIDDKTGLTLDKVAGGALEEKEYTSSSNNGMGRVVLRKNIVEGVNTLTQNMINKSNTIYVIQYDFTLDEDITVPENCILDFQGGSLNNGRIILSNTTIKSNCTNYIFNCELVGSTNSVLSPFMFGFKEGADNSYSVIYRTHVTANRLNTTISYIGINRVNIMIENNSFISIPLTGRDDFNNVEFHVTRNYKSEKYNPYYLFTLNGSEDIIDNNITVAQISSGSYSLENNKQYTLFVKDKVLWTNRYLSSSGHDRYREDCICIRNNKAINTTCDEYKSTDSIECTLIENKPYIRYLKNLIIIREESIDRCFPIKIEYVSNMEISNVILNTIKTSNTPENGDSVFILFHSTFVTFKNVHINNAYARTDSGHGYELDTCYHIVFDNITGYDDYWGTFASNNVNDITIYNSNINRFDIHCYGKDVKFYNCTFGGIRFNSFGNMYGVVSFENCIFLWQTRPVYLDHSYNAYTYFDIVFKNCQFYCNSIITVQGIYKEINPRPELSDKYLPSVYMDNIFYYDTDKFILFDVTNPTDLTIENEYKGIKGIYNISINNFIDKAQYPHSYSIINKYVTLLNTTKLSFNNCDFTQVRNYKEITNETYYPTFSFDRFKPIVNGSHVAFNLCNIAYNSIISSAFDYSYENSNIIGYTGNDLLDKVSYVKYRNCQIVLKDVQYTPILVNSSYDNCIFIRHKANQVITFNKQGHYRFKDCHVDAITPYENGYIRAFINDMSLNIDNSETNENKIDLINNELTDLFVEKTSDDIYYRSNYSFVATSERYSPFEYITSKKGVNGPVIHYGGITYKLSLENI